MNDVPIKLVRTFCDWMRIFPAIRNWSVRHPRRTIRLRSRCDLQWDHQLLCHETSSCSTKISISICWRYGKLGHIPEKIHVSIHISIHMSSSVYCVKRFRKVLLSHDAEGELGGALSISARRGSRRPWNCGSSPTKQLEAFSCFFQFWCPRHLFFPQQRKLMGSSAQISSGVCRCGSQEQVPEEGSGGRFQKVPESSGVCWCRFRRQLPEGSGGFRYV